MQKKQLIRGRILYASGDKLYLSRGARILKSVNGGKSWQPWVALPMRTWHSVAMGVPLLARLFRLGVHHLTFCGERAVAVANRESVLIEGGQVLRLGTLHGSRPMALCSTEDSVYYGEYRSNPERSAVHIWSLDFAARQWRPAWRFEGVRHVHGVFHDPFTGAIWVTTGDSDEEAAIWRTDDRFATLYRVVGGTQQFRAVQLLFSPDHVYFGSDAPDEPNHIYRMNRSGSGVEKLASVGGSVFYGSRVGEKLIFSTAVEPSEVNTSMFAEVWRSDDGANWQKILQAKKDSLPMKYFQYGQVLFPNAPENYQGRLYYTPFAVKGHGKTCQFDL